MSSNQYLIGKSVLDCLTQSLSCNDKTYKLPAKVFDLLKLFLTNDDQIVSRDDAIKVIWQGNDAVGDKGFTNAIWILRKAFKDVGENSDVFYTIPKIGYQLSLPMTAIETKKVRSKSQYKTFLLFLAAIACVALLIFFIPKTFSNSNNTKTKNTAYVDHNHYKVTTYEGIEEHPAVSHNGQYIAFLWNNNNASNGLYIQNLKDDGSSLYMTGKPANLNVSPVWSENDESLAYVSISKDGECQVRVKNLVTEDDIFIDNGCYYRSYRRVLDWSNANALIYSKVINSRVALFQYNFTSKQTKQITFPANTEMDFAPRQMLNNEELFFIRQRGTQRYDVLNMANDKEITAILQNKVSIIDIDLDPYLRSLYVNFSENTKFVIKKIELDNDEQTTISNLGYPSTFSLNIKTQQLLIANHISKEYLAQVDVNSGKIIRKVSSSSRDMYGRFSVANENILFLSNRSGMWSIWLNNGIKSVNLTKGLGNATVPAISADGKKFAVKVLSEKDKTTSLYIGNIEDHSMSAIDIQDLEADNLSWSKDGKTVFFFAGKEQQGGIYQLNVATQQLQQLTNAGEYYLVEADNNDLFVSRFGVNGVWKLDPISKQLTKLTDHLDRSDYGSFFGQNGFLYYLKRTQTADEIWRIAPDNNETLVVSFSANIIRKHFGISKADKESLLVTMKLSNESDIRAIEMN